MTFSRRDLLRRSWISEMYEIYSKLVSSPFQKLSETYIMREGEGGKVHEEPEGIDIGVWNCMKTNIFKFLFL
jgi:hypothetical protein